MSIDLKRQYNNRQALRRQATNSINEIGVLPGCKDIKARINCDKSLLYFLEYCFPNVFSLKFPESHIDVISNIERVIINGGLQAISMSRGHAKTTITSRALIWAILTGRREYCIVMGASKKSCVALMKQIKTLLADPQSKLLEIYPEAIYPIVRLEGVLKRSQSQTYKGKKTAIQFSENIVMPTIEGSNASGNMIGYVSPTSSFRGLFHIKQNGKRIRPSFIMFDDILTTQKASSQLANDKLEQIVQADALKLAGQDQDMAGLFLGTIVKPGDVCERYIDRKKKPQWNGIKYPFLKEMPKDLSLWQSYKDIFYEKGGIQANEFFRQNQSLFNQSTEAIWPELHKPSYISAVHQAVDEWTKDKQSFMSQYMLNPLVKNEQFATNKIDITNITEDFKLIDLKGRNILSIDVNNQILTYSLTNWDKKSRIFNYGTWPKQPSHTFNYKKPSIGLSQMYVGLDETTKFYNGLIDLINDLKSKYKIDGIIIDRGWQSSIEAVNSVVKELQDNKIQSISYKGYSVGVKAKKSMNEWSKADDQIAGNNYVLKTKPVNYILPQTNFFKTIVKKLIDDDKLKVYKNTFSSQHNMFYSHLLAEYFTIATVNGRGGYYWSEVRSGIDNHLLDCLVMSCVMNTIMSQSDKVTKIQNNNNIITKPAFRNIKI